MKIFQIINNNVVSVIIDGYEVIAMGKGIGFKAKKGDKIAEDNIIKLFVPNDFAEFENVKERIKSLPIEIMQLTVDIIDYAKTIIVSEISDSIYLTLSDHISHAVKYYNKKNKLANPILHEIKYLYKKEFAVGLYAIKAIDKRCGVRMTDYEAGNIALHIVNSRFNYANGEAVKMMTLINDILQIISKCYKIKFNEENIEYKQFLIHLKYFSIRIIEDINEEFAPDNFLFILQREFPKEYKCSLEIKKYILKYFNKHLNDQELVYFIIYINKLALTSLN
ncbi:MAG: PRD domain-containing protein [Lachnospirales bacterium]